MKKTLLLLLACAIITVPAGAMAFINVGVEGGYALWSPAVVERHGLGQESFYATSPGGSWSAKTSMGRTYYVAPSLGISVIPGFSFVFRYAHFINPSNDLEVQGSTDTVTYSIDCERRDISALMTMNLNQFLDFLNRFSVFHSNVYIEYIQQKYALDFSGRSGGTPVYADSYDVTNTIWSAGITNGIRPVTGMAFTVFLGFLYVKPDITLARGIDGVKQDLDADNGLGGRVKVTVGNSFPQIGASLQLGYELQMWKYKESAPGFSVSTWDTTHFFSVTIRYEVFGGRLF